MTASSIDPPLSAVQPTPAELAVKLVELIHTQKFRYRNETELHRGLSMLFSLAGVHVGQEVRLTPEDRIDFFVLGVGIEVKVKGSTPNVEKQLRRYARSGHIEQLILVTSRGKHRRLGGLSLPGVDKRGEPRNVPVTIARLPWL